MKSIRIFNFLCLLLLSIQILSATENDKKLVYVSEYGLYPNTKEDAIPIVKKILEDYKSVESLTISFEQGRYDFWSENIQDGFGQATVAISLDDKKNLTIEGNNSSFIYHGRVMPFRLRNCTNVTLKNFSIDWDRPYNSQAVIVEATDNYVDMRIDAEEYPYKIVNDSILFIGEGWLKPITPNYTNLYHKTSKDILYQTRDHALGMELYSAKVSDLGNNKVRFHFQPKIKPEAGTYIVFFHGTYITDGIAIYSSKNTHLQNIDIFHTLSCGVIGYKSENIYLNKVNITTNDAKNRVFSTVADATHFNGNKGEIIFDGCSVKGAGDDFMNIHGMYAKVLGIIDSTKVRVAPNDRYIGFETGEIAWCIDSCTMQRNYEARIRNQETIIEDGKVVGYILNFDQNILGKIKVGDVLENKDKTTSLTVRNCKLYKKNRARAILATSPQKVLIENNYFNSAGAAILIEGDTHLWFESGAVSDMEIRNNIFEDCYTSGNNIVDNPWGWGEAVISITPSVKPDGVDFLAYHKNIVIENNIFKHFDYAILYARSTDNLVFKNNKLYKTNNYQPFYRKVNFYLDGCRNVLIKNNTFSEDFPGKNIFIKNMRSTDLTLSGKTKLEIVTTLTE